jgi:uncharacterized protein (TIGR03435 family)
MIKHVLTGAGLAVLLSGTALCQTGSEFTAVPLVVANDKLPEFEVADIQVTKDTGQPRAQFLPGGRVQLRALPMKFMILAAWGYENDEGRVAGGPGWMSSEKFDIVAKAQHDSSILTLRLMLRALLIKRFGLEAHIEERPMPVYALVKGKGDLKIKPSAAEGALGCKRSNEDGVITVACHNMTMDEFANGVRGMAPAYIDKPVVNLTELKGAYDFKLGWTPRGLLLGTAGGRGGGAAEGAAAPDGAAINASEPTAGGMTVFDAVYKQLGLKLETSRHPIPIVVVDKVNRTPTEN